MKTLLMAAAAVAVIAAPVWAADMDNAFGNTVRVTVGEDSWDTWFQADGSFTDSRGVTGTWSIDDQLCIEVMTEEGAQSSCGPWNSDLQVGGSWMTDGWSEDGVSMTVELVAGL